MKNEEHIKYRISDINEKIRQTFEYSSTTNRINREKLNAEKDALIWVLDEEEKQY